MRRREWVLQDEEGKGGGGGGSAGGVDAATARAFVTEFVHDPKVLEGMADDQVVAYHGKLSGAIDKVRPAGGKWPDSWREEMADDFEKEKDQLSRYQTPKDIWKKARSLEQRISSGEYKRAVPFPEKGDDAEKAAWRKEQGLPESHDKYEIKYPDGFVLGEADKPLVERFLKDAFDGNTPPSVVNRTVNWFFQNRAEEMKAVTEAQAKHAQEVEETLRNEWGGEYRKGVSEIDGFLSEFVESEALRADLKNATKGNADFAKLIRGLAAQLNPAGTVLPNTGGDQVQALSDRLATLKKMMGDKNSEYWSKDKGQRLQDEYRKLLEAQSKVQERRAA